MTLPYSKKWSALLRGITSKQDGDLHCLNCLHSFRAKNKLESHKKVWENKDFCNVVMSSEDTKILEFNKYHKFDKTSFIIYGNLESLIEKIDGCKNNPEKSTTTKLNEHIPSDSSMSTILLLKDIEKKHNVYKGVDCMKKFCESLREQIMKIISFTNEQQELYENSKISYIGKEKFEKNMLKIKEIAKLGESLSLFTWI